MKTVRPTDRIDHSSAESRRFPANFIFKGKDDYRIIAESHPYSGEASKRHSRNNLLETIDRLSERDFEILTSLKYAKYLMTGQIQRLHITDASTQNAASRATTKNMRKLKDLGLVSTFKRRIGGTHKGSASYVWHLTEAGKRLLDLKDNEEPIRRSRRFLEPNFAHMRHTIAVSECYVQLVEISRKYKKLILAEVEWEPDCWRPYRKDGHDFNLKPDLAAAIYNDGYEDRWFIEIDLNTEALPVVMDKCKRYHYYLHTKAEQKQHGMFPVVIWIVPDENRKQKIIEACDKTFEKQPKMFAVILPNEFEDIIRHGADPKKLH